MKSRKITCLIMTFLTALSLASVLAACGVKASEVGEWYLMTCADEDGNVLAYGTETPATNGDKMDMVCVIRDNGNVFLRQNKETAYGTYRLDKKAQEQEGKVLQIIFDDDSTATAVCATEKIGGGEFQTLVIRYDGKVYSFIKGR